MAEQGPDDRAIPNVVAVETEDRGPGTERLDRRALLRRVRAEIAEHGLSPEHEAAAAELAERLVTGPSMSRRRLMQATAAGWAAIAVAAVHRPVRAANGLAGVADLWLPVSPLTAAITAATPTLTASVLRREDMLALRIEFYNLVRSGSNLVRQASGNPAYIVATFGYGADDAPQNIAEQAFPESADPLPPGDVQARLAGPTRLAFLVPATLTSIPYQLTTILGLIPQLRLNVVPAALAPDATPSSAPAIVEPGALDTRIEAPWHLVLSPHAAATWTHATTPVTHNGRTELWHTRLSENDAVGRALRAVWTDGYDASGPTDPDLPFLTSLDAQDRWEIVRLTSDFGISGFTPAPVHANRLMLSALGAWLDSDAVWPEPPTGISLTQWRHIATMGRDQFVKIVRLGFLFPFGHPAVKVEITERKISPVPSGGLSGKPAAYLRRREFIVVREPVVTYPDAKPQPDKGRQMPFSRVELRTLVTPDITQETVAGFPDQAFWPLVDGQPFPFNVAGFDRDGRAAEFTMPLIFIDKELLEKPATADTAPGDIVDAYNAADIGRRQRDLHGQKVSFTANAKPGDSSVEVTRLTFGAVEPDGTVDARKAPFFPTWTAADVRLDAVGQIRGQDVGSGGVKIVPHPDFLTKGFGADNPGEVFAKLDTPAPLTFSDGGGDRSGGVITPDMQIVNLSRSLGPQGGKGDGLPAKFDPTDYFDGAKILGGIDLADILEAIDFGTDGFRVPEIKSRPVYDGPPSGPPKAIETTFNFKPKLKPDKKKIFTPKPDGSLSLDVTYRTPVVPPGEPTYEIVGDLRRFMVTLIPGSDDTRFIRLHFSRLTFTARSGRKPDINPYIDKVELDGPLKFVDSIKDYLKSPGTGPNIDITPSQVSAGFTLQIPNIPAGAVTIINIAFSATLIIPFNGDPARARFAMSSREHPFMVTYLALGGGGFFAIELALDGVKYFELDIVAGVEAAIDLILVTAEVHYLFGCHLGIDSDGKVDQISYIRIGGHCGVWGVWSVSLDMYLALTYDSASNELWGQARFTIEVEYVFLSKSVDLFVERRIAGPGGTHKIDESATAMLSPGADSGFRLASFTPQSTTATPAAATTNPPLGFATLISQNEWNTYAAAFASDT